MGGRARVLVLGAPRLVDVAQRRLEALEARWSRFRADSDVSRASAAAGAPVAVAADTICLARACLRGQAVTDGRFDPLLGHLLAALGYDRSFERIEPDTIPAPLRGRSPGGFLHLDEAAGTVTVPAGRAWDPGGIGKGLAADVVAGELLAMGADGVLVDLGGDIRVGGIGPTEGGWSIGIEDPFHPGEELLRILLREGAVASSSTLRRRWRQGGVDRHHLLDPDGLPVANGVVAVSVLADEGWRAEVLTKAALLAGPSQVIAELDRHAVDGVAVLDDGTRLRTAGLRADR